MRLARLDFTSRLNLGFAINCKPIAISLTNFPPLSILKLPSKTNRNGAILLGSLKLPLSKFPRYHYYTVFGGPYNDRTTKYIGVNLAAEIKKPADIVCPTQDFSVPDTQQLTEALLQTVDKIVDGYPVYVGCMGGRGRTGLFLAILAKAFGVKSPVTYVRQNYFAHAVETAEQQLFVADYEIPKGIRTRLRKAWLLAFFSRRVSLTDVPK
jgi:hypothetical protein